MPKMATSARTIPGLPLAEYTNRGTGAESEAEISTVDLHTPLFPSQSGGNNSSLLPAPANKVPRPSISDAPSVAEARSFGTATWRSGQGSHEFAEGYSRT